VNFPDEIPHSSGACLRAVSHETFTNSCAPLAYEQPNLEPHRGAESQGVGLRIRAEAVVDAS
jgi:hypothetical protein